MPPPSLQHAIQHLSINMSSWFTDISNTLRSSLLKRKVWYGGYIRRRDCVREIAALLGNRWVGDLGYTKTKFPRNLLSLGRQEGGKIVLFQIQN